jgi:hypothetical protein
MVGTGLSFDVFSTFNRWYFPHVIHDGSSTDTEHDNGEMSTIEARYLGNSLKMTPLLF